MDIRNFREFEKAPTHTTIEAIFGLQKQLIDGYVTIENLPRYPIDIHDPVSQVILKDFSARVVEELGEAYESLEVLMQYMSTVKDGWNPPEIDPEKVLPALYNFNEEIADAIHFMVELMVYSGYYPKDILKDDPSLEGEEVDIFKYIQANYEWDMEAAYMPQIPITKDQDNIFIQGGRPISAIYLTMVVRNMWAVIYPLQLARNALKNKPWKQRQMLSDRKVYKSNTIRAFIALVCLCLSAGINEEAFYNIYLAKNKVNRFRQESRY